jgi:hypothetical protein
MLLWKVKQHARFAPRRPDFGEQNCNQCKAVLRPARFPRPTSATPAPSTHPLIPLTLLRDAVRLVRTHCPAMEASAPARARAGRHRLREGHRATTFHDFIAACQVVCRGAARTAEVKRYLILLIIFFHAIELEVNMEAPFQRAKGDAGRLGAGTATHGCLSAAPLLLPQQRHRVP